ncbi:MAG: hypothetical protein ACXVCP_16135 [Bdellovibrio sp.]
MKRKPDLEIIRRYLQWWDPMNLIEDLVLSGNPPDEYDSYAKEIHAVLESNGGLFLLVALLEDIQINRMEIHDEDRNKDRDRKFAEGLLKCYSEFEDRFY